MKKLYAELFSSVFLLFLILGLCLFCSCRARQQVGEVRALVLTTPTAEEFEKMRTDPVKVEELKEQTKILQKKLKKAGSGLAYFINYEYLSRAHAAASSFLASISSEEDADYGNARQALLDTLSNVERLEKLSWELFL